LFPGLKDFPKVGLYFEVDYWQKPGKEMSDDEILRLITIFSREGWTRQERVARVILW
jgi:hypothetical protein